MIEQKWYLIDAEGQILGRLASKIAVMLMGKNKPEYKPNADTGDFVVIINSDKITVTGKKREQKKYYRATGYIGNLKEETFNEKMKKDSRKVIQLAVKRMLPKNKLGDKMFKKLFVYKKDAHRHAAQKPEILEV